MSDNEKKMTPPPAPATMTVTFSIEELNMVLRGLGKLPAEESFQLIQRIHVQFNKMQQEAANAPNIRKFQEDKKPE
jgi:hypothetical protein